ncbi:methyltransferase [Shewanella sp.]|uniref:methyltransferase n=1 Tax=Shewanella sp. TaxID=50422 RepID=UPI003A970C02
MLTAPSEILIRNQSLLADKQVLLLNHEADRCPEQLLAVCDSVTTLALDYPHFQLQPSNKAKLYAEFGHKLAATSAQAFDTVVIYFPKAKPLLDYLLHLAAYYLKTDGELIVIGDNKGGIRSFNKLKSTEFSPPIKLDNARHCLLFASTVLSHPTAIDIDRFVSQYTLKIDNQRLTICNMVGTFSEKQLDQGTALLLEHLPTLTGRALDFGCGAGVITAALLARFPALEMECVDINAMALLSCEKTLAANGMQAKIYASDGLSRCTAGFDAIISNPPFHDGLMSTTDIATQFVKDSQQQLRRGGLWQIVANRHLPYADGIAASFGNVNVVAENNRYKIYKNIK